MGKNNSTNKTDISIFLSELLMKPSGCWLAVNDGEKRRRIIARNYSFTVLLFGLYCNVNDICHSFDDIPNILYMAGNLFFSSMALLRTFLLHLNKERFLKLITYTKQNFWNLQYDDDEKVFVKKALKKFTFFVVITYFVTFYIVCSFVVLPIYLNTGKNQTDRALPLRMWSSLPLYETPYFEICFVLQTISILQVAICYLCVDNLLILINTFAVCHFRILQYKVFRIIDGNSDIIGTVDYANKCYESFKAYIRQHQSLINYCGRVELVFSFNILSYVLVFSVVTCLSLYQALLGDVNTLQRLSFMFYVLGGILQLIMLTNSSGSLITESENVGTAAYELLWYAFLMNKPGRSIRRDVQMVIMRSQKPCQLTAGGFFPVSLQTSTKLITSAMSYFTLLKESSSNIN